MALKYPAIQLAVLSGFEVTTTCSPAHFAYLKSLGATTVIDRSAPDVAEQILAATGGPVKYTLDAVALEPTQLVAVEVTQPQGTLVPMLCARPAVQSAADAKGVVLAHRSGMDGRFFEYVFIL
jgi:NADPH:quinone reductase-like Zn-dependent oxidoreductase